MESGWNNITHMRTMVLVYLPTKLGDFGQGQMLGFIFQHHGSHMGITQKSREMNGFVTYSMTYSCLVGNRWEWNGMIIDS